MKLRHLTLTVAVWAALSGLSKGQVRPSIPLPVNPFAVVIQLESVAAWSGTRNDRPVITIHADGTVTVRDLEPAGAHGTMTTADLQELLRFAIEEQGFFSLDAGGSYRPLSQKEQSLEEQGLKIIIDHAPVIRLSIQTADRQHTVRLDLRSGRSPSEPFAAIENRLRRLAEEIEAGGRARVQEALRVANERVAQERPAWPQFSMLDFESTQAYGRGRRLTFYRKDDAMWQQVEVYYFDGQPSVRLTTGAVESDLLGLPHGARSPTRPQVGASTRMKGTARRSNLGAP